MSKSIEKVVLQPLTTKLRSLKSKLMPTLTKFGASLIPTVMAISTNQRPEGLSNKLLATSGTPTDSLGSLTAHSTMFSCQSTRTSQEPSSSMRWLFSLRDSWVPKTARCLFRTLRALPASVPDAKPSLLVTRTATSAFIATTSTAHHAWDTPSSTNLMKWNNYSSISSIEASTRK